MINFLINRKVVKKYFFLLVVFVYAHTLFSQYPLANFPMRIDGELLKNPWVGGMNNPQFSQVDFNFDGFQDMYVFDRLGAVSMVFLYEDGEYVYDQTYSYNMPKLVNFAIFKDFNNDGIEDLFTYHFLQGIPGIQVYKGVNNGNNVLTFEPFVQEGTAFPILYYTDPDFGLQNLYLAATDLPVLSDIDNDGDLDILAFDVDGGFVRMFKNTTVENQWGLDTLAFELSDRCWGRFFESESSEEISLSSDPNLCATGESSISVNFRHPGSAILVVDQDEDNPLKDLVLTDIGSNKAIYLKNNGTTSRAWMTEQILNFPTTNPVNINVFPAIFSLDYNFDGRDDLIFSPNSPGIVEDVNVAWLYRNNGGDLEQRYELVQKDFLNNTLADFGTSSYPAIADVNGDGLPDIVVAVANKYNPALPSTREVHLNLLLNTGTRENPSFELSDTNWLDMKAASTTSLVLVPSFGDLDGDGDIDLIISDDKGYLYYFENTAGKGAPLSFKTPIYQAFGIQTGTFAAATMGDIDGDGLTDLLIGERLGFMTFFKNIGSLGNPVFNGSPTAFPNEQGFAQIDVREPNSGPGFASPYWFSNGINNFILSGRSVEGLLLYENTGAHNQFVKINSSLGDMLNGERTRPAIYDLDGDGFFEIIVGNSRGGISIFHSDIKDETVNVEDNYKNLSFQMYPNPAQNKLFISWDNLVVDRPVTFTILSIGGTTIIKSKEMNISGNIEIDISSLKSGIYLVHFETANRTGVQKLIVIK